MFGNFMVQTIFDNHSNFSNLPLVCPVIKGIYHVRDMPITDKFITGNVRILLPDIVKYKIVQTYFLKLHKKSSLIEIINLHIDGVFIK